MLRADIINSAIRSAKRKAEKANALPVEEWDGKLREAAMILSQLTEEYSFPASALEMIAYAIFLWEY